MTLISCNECSGRGSTVIATATALFIALMSHQAHASGSCKEIPPIDDFICNTNAKFVLCRLEVGLALLESKNRPQAQKCVEEGKEAIKPIYQTARRAIGRNAGAQAALKDLYSYWLTSMDSLWPDMGMRQYQYEAQLQKRQLGIDERGNKLRVEMQ